MRGEACSVLTYLARPVALMMKRVNLVASSTRRSLYAPPTSTSTYVRRKLSTMVSSFDQFKEYRPHTPSPRTPRYSTHHNNADNVESYLQEDGHQTWGFVIYRCSYESDDDWDQFMKRLRYRTRCSVEAESGLDMMDSLSMTVFEDRSLFDGASTSNVREHFKQWAATAPQLEQGTGPALSQRYRYCVQVDAVALKSVIHDAPAPPAIDVSSKGFVNLIWLDWDPSSPEARGEETGEPIEGCIVHDVGWMRVAYQDLMVGMYYFLRDYSDWYHEYRRPPIVAHS